MLDETRVHRQISCSISPTYRIMKLFTQVLVVVVLIRETLRCRKDKRSITSSELYNNYQFDWFTFCFISIYGDLSYFSESNFLLNRSSYKIVCMYSSVWFVRSWPIIPLYQLYPWQFVSWDVDIADSELYLFVFLLLWRISEFD